MPIPIPEGALGEQEDNVPMSESSFRFLVVVSIIIIYFVVGIHTVKAVIENSGMKEKINNSEKRIEFLERKLISKNASCLIKPEETK